MVARGSLRGAPYLVQDFVEGGPGQSHRSLELWRTIGGYARIVQEIPITTDAPEGLFSRFGRDLSAAWHADLGYNLDQLVADDPLLALGVYRAEEQARLRARLRRLRDVAVGFGLSHGDLHPRNVIVPRAGPPVLIDWGSASAGPVPYGDLRPLLEEHRAAGDPSAAELQAFADGLGGSLEDLSETLEDMIVLRALDLVRWAIDRRPDRLDDVVASSRAALRQTPSG